jgi:hypothetical protein
LWFGDSLTVYRDLPPLTERNATALIASCSIGLARYFNRRRAMAQTVADQFAETLAAAGVKRIYGIVGDSLNGLTDAIRRQGKIEWIHVRHEEVAAFAAGAEAHLTGELTVCAGSCGPGNLHLVNGLLDCHRSRVPVLAIAAHIPSAEIGASYFQETFASSRVMLSIAQEESLFGRELAFAKYCENEWLDERIYQTVASIVSNRSPN